MKNTSRIFRREEEIGPEFRTLLIFILCGLICFVLLLFSVATFAQTRPSSTVSQNTGGICVGCSVTNADNAWDTNTSSFASFNFGIVGVGAYGEAVYSFASPIPTNNIVSFLFKFEGSAISLSPDQVYKRLKIAYQDAAGTELISYDDFNLTAVTIINAATNTIEINILNTNANTQRILIQSGDLLSVGLGARDFRIFDIQYNEDLEAIYTLEPFRPVDAYSTSDILATAFDPDGDIVSATVTFGALPPGTTLASDGTISVSSQGALIEGTYSFTVTTTDSKSGTTVSPLSITIYPADIEAIYTINPPKPVNDYTNGNTLATATDANGAIVAAVVSSGSLPAGTSLAADGTIAVSNASALVSGTYNFQVTTTDVNGGTTVSPLSITIHPADIEAVYTINNPKPVNDYGNGDILATATDANGAIVSAVVSSGSLPSGTSLASEGTITVTNSGALLPGTYNFQVTTTDVNGGVSVNSLAIVIHPADIEAVYTINNPKPVNDYINGNILATVTDANGPIVSAVVSSGSLPAGTALASNGMITVSNASLLVAGTYGFQVTTTDVNGGVTASNLSITFNPADTEAVYNINPFKPINDFTNGNVLATVSDADGAIISATVNSGALPAGTTLLANGTIQVANTSSLLAGTYNVGILTTDVKNGTTLTNVVLTIHPADIEGIYTIPSAKSINDYANGNFLATASDGNGPIINATINSGVLPAGTILQPNGNIVVTNANALLAGSYPLQINTQDNKGGTTLSTITLTINSAIDPDEEAVYTVNPSQPSNQIENGDILATVSDPDGAVVNAVLSGGSLPGGVTLQNDGSIVVTNSAALTPGTYNITVTTTDVLGGTTVANVTLVIDPPFVENVTTGISKQAGVPQLQQDGAYKIVFTIKVENFGNILVPSIQIVDDLALAFPAPATFSVAGLTATGMLQVNTAYNGNSDKNLLLSSSKLDVGQTSTLLLTVLVNPNGLGDFENFAEVQTKNATNTVTFSDISDNGNDPDSNGNGDPTDLNENDPTPIHFTLIPVLGVAKAASVPMRQTDGSYIFDYTITAENLGNAKLEQVQLTDDLSTTFPSPATFTVTQISTLGTLQVNTGYNGTTDKNLLTPGNTLDIGVTQQIKFSVKLEPNGSPGPFSNQVEGTATGAGGTGAATDISANGYDPDPNGNGYPSDPGEDGGTLSYLNAPVIGLAKSGKVLPPDSGNEFQVTFQFTVKNLGGTALQEVAVYDDLSAVFSLANSFSIVSLGATGSLVPNSSFDGITDINLLSAQQSTLALGETEIITLELKVIPEGDFKGPFYNSALGFAFNEDKTLGYTDVSNNGNEPDPNHNGFPDDANENVPTTVYLKILPVLGVANQVTEPVLQLDGSYQIDLIATLENLGNDNLENVRLQSDWNSTFPSPLEIISITTPSGDEGLTINPSFNGISDIQLLQGGSLPVGETYRVAYTVKVHPNGQFGIFYNDAKASALGEVSDLLTSDFSTDGTRSDPNGDGIPDENIPTPIVLNPTNVIGLGLLASEASWEDNCSFLLTLIYRVKNFGLSPLNQLQVTDNLGALFLSPATYSVVSIETTSGLIANMDYDGMNDLNLLAANNSLDIGEYGTIELTIRVMPSGLTGTFYHNSMASGVMNNTTVSSISFNLDTNADFDTIVEPATTTTVYVPSIVTFIPQGFSPNGDQKQDYFHITVVCGVVGKLSVFNRWGDKVYFAEKYNNDWGGESNQGSVLGSTLPNGVYYYALELSDGSKIKSFVVINR